jgi:serine/threonine protein kinase
VKTLKTSDALKFQTEVNMLKKFNGLVHDHLVTLLGTFTHKQQFSMIFPSAECDVEKYWEDRNPSPNSEDIEFVRWVSRQCRGIMEAVNVIHNPKHSAALPTEIALYGRHGDIKAENILWFKSPDDAERGIWVISDLGLSAFNREVSRSMVPNQSILYTPGYRPPECDIEGGKISRAFDIWTLGCFYLEMACWFLGGWQLKDDFEKDRTTTFLTGSRADIFFDIELNGEDKTNETFIVLIKPQVVKVRSLSPRETRSKSRYPVPVPILRT